MVKVYKFIFIFLIIAAVVIFLDNEVLAQCSMCRKIAGDAADKANNGIAQNLNPAILYLLTIPYILLALVFRKHLFSVFRFFWHWKKM
jgi:hypothetical protein